MKGAVVTERATAGPRARYRAQVRDEVQQLAWEQIEQAGASALSLKAIATTMGMTAPALYRYFAGRDELLTELILAAYTELAVVVETAAAATPVPQQRLLAIAAALRDWALQNPQRYLLLYGTPVPGYAAPPEATALASRILAPLLAGFSELGQRPVDVTLVTEDQAGGAADTDAFSRSVVFWTRLHGVLSLELAGHFAGMGLDTSLIYDHETRSATS